MKSLFKNKLLFVDGAMGTSLGNITSLPEIYNIENPEKIKAIHDSFLKSGANIITTNTFGANRLKLQNSGFSVSEVVTAAVKLAKECTEKFDGDRYVSLDIGPIGTLLKPMGITPFSEAYDIFSEMVKAGVLAGADIISIETMTDTYEMKAAVLAAKENSKLPIIATMSIDENGKLLTGGDILSIISLLEGLRVDALGFNCSLGPIQLKGFFDILAKFTSIPIAILPNAGLPTMKNGETIFDSTPEEFSEIMKYFAENGAYILGGCCGTTPKHIELMVSKCKDIIPKPLVNKGYTMVSAFGNAVLIGDVPVIIGERINPTGKKRFKEALREMDFDYIINEGISQADAGADILDVNVGLPEIDEVAVMEKAVYELQSVLSLPLQIDSSDKNVLERALRIYNGKALINSVNGKYEVMEEIFPLVQKYGGVVVALTLDESGIPSTAEDRIKIAEKTISTAKKYGIDKKDIIIDTLTLTVSSNQNEAKETLKALKLAKEELYVNTVLGVSNVSFGLPKREIINSTFFAMALQNGLSAAIINPLSESMMQSYNSFNVLYGFDKECFKYISAYGGEQATLVKTEQNISLHNIVIKGLKNISYEAAIKELEIKAPLDIINNSLIPALDIVGNDFASGKLFLPQLLTSAETAKNAFEAIKSKMTKNDIIKKNKIILATVKGDIHDIGKNIVKLLLENYGFDVIDLGKDVSEELIVKTAIEQNIKLIGLSALMTTTVVSMEKTIKALKEARINCKVMVGGAVLTQEYADMIGADFYGKDALASVEYAKSFFA